CTDLLYLIPETNRPPLLGHLRAEGLEVVGRQVVHEPAAAERLDEPIRRGRVLPLRLLRVRGRLVHTGGYLARLPLPLLRRQEAIAQFGDRQPFALDAGGAAGVQVVGDGPVLLQGLLPAVALDADELAVLAPGPAAEVVDLAADLLLPLAGRMRREGEVGVGL